MFPTLRLVLSASVATVVLMALVGSGLVLLLPPPARLADVPEIVRPVTPILDDIRHAVRFDDAARRNAELQRLASLPAGPSRAYAAEPPATFPYRLDPVPADAVTADVGAAVPVTDPIVEPNTDPGEDGTAEPAARLAALPEPVEAAPVSFTGALGNEPPAGTEQRPDAGASHASAAATGPRPEPEQGPLRAEASAAAGQVSLPEPKVALADPGAVDPAQSPVAKPQAPMRPRAKAKKTRPAASRRVRKPLPAPTAFETRQGQFPFFGYGNTWDNRTWETRAGWTTDAVQRQRAAPVASWPSSDTRPTTSTP